MRVIQRLLSACVVLGSLSVPAGAFADDGVVSDRAAAAAGQQLAQGLAVALRSDPTFAARVDAVQQQYEAAVVAGDAEAVAALFTHDGAFMPFSGGAFEGSDAIRAFTAERPRPSAMDVWSEDFEIAGSYVFDRGGFRLEAGGAVLSGEYVAWVEDTADGLKLRRLITYLPRAMPQQQAAR